MTHTLHYRPCSDLILWDETIDQPELQRNFQMGKDVDVTLRQSILAIVHDNWDSFYERGVSRPMLDFEFCLNTSNSPPRLLLAASLWFPWE